MKTAVISKYTIDGNPRRAGADDIHIERAKQMEGPAKWAVRRMGECLNKQGEWEYEPMPSSRDDEFLARCRFDTPEDAFAAVGVMTADPLRQAAEQFVASCKDGNVADLIDYYEDIFTEALGVNASPTVADYESVLADHARLVRELDVLLNGEASAAKQASLCDIVSQVRREGIRSLGVSLVDDQPNGPQSPLEQKEGPA